MPSEEWRLAQAKADKLESVKKKIDSRIEFLGKDLIQLETASKKDENLISMYEGERTGLWTSSGLISGLLRALPLQNFVINDSELEASKRSMQARIDELNQLLDNVVNPYVQKINQPTAVDAMLKTLTGGPVQFFRSSYEGERNGLLSVLQMLRQEGI